MGRSFQCAIFIPFHLSDPAGILFFGHVFSLTHTAYEQFVLHQLEFKWDQWFQNSDWILPIIHTEAQFHAPIKAGQECWFELSVASIGHTSFTLTSLLSQQTLCCTVKTTHVFCQPKSHIKIPIPLNILNQLKKQ